MNLAPTDRIDTRWKAELFEILEPALRDPQIRLLLDAQTMMLLERLKEAPSSSKFVERVDRRDIDPIPTDEADIYLDSRTGLRVVYERGQWWRDTSPPAGAMTVGELAQLDWLMWAAVERAADLAEVGALTRKQRRAAQALVEFSEALALRLRVLAIHPDPEQARAIKESALAIISGDPALRLLNRSRSFLDRKHDWKEVLVRTPQATLTRGQIRDLYMRNAKRVVDGIQGYDALVLLGIGPNKTVLRRHGPDGKNIRITKIHGIEDPHALEYWANRRLVELHRVVGPKTDVVWVDLDPKGDGDLRKLIRKLTPQIETIVAQQFSTAHIQSWDSGKRGVHVEGYLPRKVDVDVARRKLRTALDKAFADDDRFTTGIARPGQIRLDVTTLKSTGSVRAPYSPTIEGRIKKPL